jgi:hypothetical protein
MDKKVEIYCCYAYEDSAYLQRLKAHLSPFLRNGSLLFWDDTNIDPGTLWQNEVNKHLERASIVLLLERSDVYVSFARWIISPLAKLEKLAEQIDACTTTLELYKQKYLTQDGRLP